MFIEGGAGPILKAKSPRLSSLNAINVCVTRLKLIPQAVRIQIIGLDNLGTPRKGVDEDEYGPYSLLVLPLSCIEEHAC